ncbi:MAG: hypothetical protein EOO28_06160 [Comamonadaceae bacterium]|nr:MAG: hypothetical protein EOO28_06160 [Comamonadaceae bacterium]
MPSASKPGLVPADELLFFASPKKSNQKKGDPAVCVPSAGASGKPAVLGLDGVKKKLACGSDSFFAFSRPALRSSAQTEGVLGKIREREREREREQHGAERLFNRHSREGGNPVHPVWYPRIRCPGDPAQGFAASPAAPVRGASCLSRPSQ